MIHDGVDKPHVEQPKHGWYAGDALTNAEPKVPVQIGTEGSYRRFSRLPEALVRLAHEEYARHHDQSFERLHERGGFGLIEIIMLLADNVNYWKGQAQRGSKRQVDIAIHNCEASLTEKHGSLTSGYWKDGTELVCTCGKKWVHVCDESEGCSWQPS